MDDVTYVYVTKYSLSKPIYKAVLHYKTARIYCVEDANGHKYYFNRSECFEDEETALAAAENLRMKKIEAAKKQIARLQTRVFTIADMPTFD